MVKDDAADTSEGGIILVESVKEPPLTASVVAIGPEVKAVVAGDEVIYPAFAATTFSIAGNEVFVIDEDDIMLVLREVPDDD